MYLENEKMKGNKMVKKKILKTITTEIYDDGSRETTEKIRDPSDDYLAKDEPRSGIQAENMILYADGSTRDISGYVPHPPQPIGPNVEYPQARYIKIRTYWQIKHEQLENEFEELKATLKRRGESFEVRGRHLPKDQKGTDAVERLRQLRRKIKESEKKYWEADEAVEAAIPQSVVDSRKRQAENAERKEKFAEEVDRATSGKTKAAQKISKHSKRTNLGRQRV